MLEIAIHNSSQHQQYLHAADTFVLARCGDGPWISAQPDACQHAQSVLEICATADGVQVRVQGRRSSIDSFGDVLALPAALTVGDTHVEIAAATTHGGRGTRQLQRLNGNSAEAKQRPGGRRDPAASTLSRWLDALATLHRWIASSPEFYQEAARFVVDPIGLDGAFILRRHDDQWEIVASHLPHPDLGIRYDTAAVDQLLRSPRTLFEGNEQSAERQPLRVLRDVDEFQNRLAEIEQPVAETVDPEGEHDLEPHAVVLAPLTDEGGALVGAVYGFRAVHSGNARRKVRHLEARLVDLLAASVSSGIARLRREATAARQRALFEQAFSPVVVDKLERDPNMLSGREREVTVLFADLRNYSSICELLGTSDSYRLLNEVMDCLTTAVMDHDGVVIDYYGDGLSAMWNAPIDQSPHPELACRAALGMLETLPYVSRAWRRRLARPLRVGIGVHTGLAAVGNVGSGRRLKYGPRGATVNLASRVEVATKRLRLPLLVTRTTADRLSHRLMTYRVCRARLRGFSEAIDLFAVTRPMFEQQTLRELDRYQQALAHYEEGRLDKAEQLLADATQASDAVPIRFLADEVRSRRHRQLGRRGTDAVDATAGAAIALDVK